MCHLKSRYSQQQDFALEFIGWRAEFAAESQAEPRFPKLVATAKEGMDATV